MDKSRFSEYALIICSFLVCFIIGFILFAFIIHELSHAAAVLLFGLRLNSFSIFQVIFETSSNSVINTIVLLSGGIGQAVAAYLSFWYLSRLKKKTSNIGVSKMLSGFRPAILTFVILGLINALLEGFFPDKYRAFNNDLTFVAMLLIMSILISFLLLFGRPLMAKRLPEYESTLKLNSLLRGFLFSALTFYSGNTTLNRSRCPTKTYPAPATPAASPSVLATSIVPMRHLPVLHV